MFWATNILLKLLILVIRLSTETADLPSSYFLDALLSEFLKVNLSSSSIIEVL